MNNDIALKVQKFVQDKKLITENDVIILGLSGGIDSIVLAEILLLIKRSINFSLFAAHLDHRLRDESSEDAFFVAAYCGRNDIPLYNSTADVKAEAKASKVSIEVAARYMRHSFFDAILKEHCNAKLALAHHMNDRAETILMRMFRGSSIDGLAAMPEMDRHIIRPLMCLTRAEIEEYANLNNINWREDASNKDVKFTRNFIRHNVIPSIEEGINPSLVSTICNQSYSFMEDKEYLNHIAKEKAMLAQKTDIGFMMDDENFMYVHPSIRKRVIKYLLSQLGKKTDLYEKNISLIEELFSNRRTGSVIELPGEYEARAHAMGVELIRKETAKEIIEEIYLSLEGITYLNTGDTITCESVKAPLLAELKHSKNVQYIDAMAIQGDLIVRSREIGDVIHPLGAKGSKKLKDYYIDKKVNRWERDYIPVIACENQIVWAIGHVVSDDYKITENTALCLKITYNKGETYEQ